MLNQHYDFVATLLNKMVETNIKAQKIYIWDRLLEQVDIL